MFMRTKSRTDVECFPLINATQKYKTLFFP